MNFLSFFLSFINPPHSAAAQWMAIKFEGSVVGKALTIGIEI